nr:retrovirus-related Pol polyprotein from transposon TNT 1-94 [Tanacetum cinerariifolium]
MQRPPLFKSDSFIYWKNRFETYVKSKDLDLCHVITNGDFQPIQQNSEIKLDEVIPFEKQSDNLKRKLAKNNEAKMVIYNALTRKEYERIFMCYSSKNYVRKFLRALHPKQRAKITSIEESKDLTSLSLDELLGNLKVYEMIIKKDSEIVKAKGERKSLALKAKKESSDEECLTLEVKMKNMSWRCGNPNNLIGECPKPPKNKNQRAFVRGSWSDSGEEDDEKVKDETCLVAQASSEEIGHANMRLIQSLASKELVRNLPKLTFDQHFCDACKIEKQAHTSPKDKNIVSTTRCLELLHMDIFSPSTVQMYRGNCYTLVIVDDYSRKVKESLSVTFDETPPPFMTSPLVDDDLDEEESIKVTKKKNLENNIEDETLEIDEIIVALQEESNQFIANDVWELVPQPKNMTIIRTKWVFRNMLDENGIVSRNKARLDIMFSLCLCARFQEDPKTSHLEAVKRIFRYIKGTTHLRLWYPKGTDIERVVYADSDHGRDYVDRKSTSGICTFVGCCLTSWFSKKQTALAISTTNIEYVSIEKDHDPACLYYMIYYVANSEKFNLAYYMAKRIKWVTKQSGLILPYGMLLTRLFKFIMSKSPELLNESYVLYDRVMNPLTAQQEQKTGKDRGTRRGGHSTSSSPAFDQPSPSHLNDDDDDGNDEENSRASTPSPTYFVKSLTNDVPQVLQKLLTLTLTWNHFTPAKLKSSTVKFKYEMSIMVD